MTRLPVLYKAYRKGVRAFAGSLFLWWMAAKAGGIHSDDWDALAWVVAVTFGVVDAENVPAGSWTPPVFPEET